MMAGGGGTGAGFRLITLDNVELKKILYLSFCLSFINRKNFVLNKQDFFVGWRYKVEDGIYVV